MFDESKEKHETGNTVKAQGSAQVAGQNLCEVEEVVTSHWVFDSLRETKTDSMRDEATTQFESSLVLPSADAEQQKACLNDSDGVHGEGVFDESNKLDDGLGSVQEGTGPRVQDVTGARQLFPQEFGPQKEARSVQLAGGAEQAKDSSNDIAMKLLYTKTMTTPLLNTPAQKAGQPISENNTRQETKRRSTRLASRPKSDLTIEQQATALLMKKCGTFGEEGEPNQATREDFTAQFVAPLEKDAVSHYRDVFGLPEGEGADKFAAIAINAEA